MGRKNKGKKGGAAPAAAAPAAAPKPAAKPAPTEPAITPTTPTAEEVAATSGGDALKAREFKSHLLSDY